MFFFSSLSLSTPSFSFLVEAMAKGLMMVEGGEAATAEDKNGEEDDFENVKSLAEEEEEEYETKRRTK